MKSAKIKKTSGNLINISQRTVLCMVAMGFALGGTMARGGPDSSVLGDAVNGEEVRFPEDATMAELLEKSGAAGGVVVHVGCGAGEQTAGLASKADKPFIVQGLDTERRKLQRARRRAVSLGRSGRLTFKHWTGGRLPYTDNMVNVLFWDEAEMEADMGELMRVLVPGGAAYIRAGGGWRKEVKPWPADIDDWSHYRYDAGNTGASNDKRAGPPKHLQWEAPPRFDRHHELESGISSVISTAGRRYRARERGFGHAFARDAGIVAGDRRTPLERAGCSYDGASAAPVRHRR